ERERGRERAAESRKRRRVQANDDRTFAGASAEASGSVRPNRATVRPNKANGSDEENRDVSEAFSGPTPPDMSARPVRATAADVRPNIRDVHLTRPDPINELTNKENGSGGEAGPRLTEHDLFNGYRARWHDRFPDSVPDGHRWAPQNCPDAPEWGNVLAKVR